jgi:hypothetical protein
VLFLRDSVPRLNADITPIIRVLRPRPLKAAFMSIFGFAMSELPGDRPGPQKCDNCPMSFEPEDLWPQTVELPGESPVVLRVPERRFVAVIFPDPGRRRLRLVFQYRDSFRVLTWMQVGADGSLYLNPRLRPEKAVIHGSGVADGRGGLSDLSVRETPLSEIDGRNSKVSVHASGVVTGPAHRSQSVSLRNVRQSTLFRQDVYEGSPHNVRLLCGSTAWGQGHVFLRRPMRVIAIPSSWAST